MQRNDSIRKLTFTALLIAVGITIPMFSPLKIVLEPASFTLASHVSIFLSMFISPGVAAAVSVGTTLGFFFGGFPLVIVLRAATHLIWATAGAFWLQRRPATLQTMASSQLFSLVIGLVHGALELLVVTVFYFSGDMGDAWYQNGFMVTILGLVGVGSVLHSMLDFLIAQGILKVFLRQKTLRQLFIHPETAHDKH